MDEKRIANRIARELLITGSFIPDEWTEAFLVGANLFNREAKKRGYIIERPKKFIGGVRFTLDSAGGKAGVQVVISLFKPFGKPWFVRMIGWVDDEMMRNVEIRGYDEVPRPIEVAKLIGKAGDKAGFWSRR